MKFAVGGFLAGVLVTWLLMTYGPPQPVIGKTGSGADSEVRLKPDATELPDATKGKNRDSTKPTPSVGSGFSRIEAAATTGNVPRKRLRVPIDGANIESFKGGFAEHRHGRAHEAVDILAPRNTPVHAVADGSIAKLFYSKGGGGITLYEFDPTGSFAYYYAHLERYADDVQEGQHVSRGQVIGYVGTSGNAPPNTPHLHFAVFELDADRKWWKGRAIDPYPLFKGNGD
jgi:murein DD-endopeptidase MepM/ murein hydrolase activator NlpD